MLNGLAKAGSFFIDAVRSFAAKCWAFKREGQIETSSAQVIFTDACFLFAVRGMRLRERLHFLYNTNPL